jgi:chaperone LolA
MKTGRTIAVVCAGVLCLTTPALAASITGSEVIERMQKSFEKMKTFSVEFEKQLYWAVLDKNVSRSGKIHTRKPGEFRLEIDEYIVVGDGVAVWAYAPENEQVIVSSYNRDLPTPWEILVEHSEQFRPVAVTEVELEGRPCYSVVMASKSNHSATGGQVEGMTVWIDKKRWHLLMVEQTEANENVTTYVLSRHRANDKIDDDLFVFSPPSGVEVIDRRDPEPTATLEVQ